jgi:hypothetical protein
MPADDVAHPLEVGLGAAELRREVGGRLLESSTSGG